MGLFDCPLDIGERDRRAARVGPDEIADQHEVGPGAGELVSLVARCRKADAGRLEQLGPPIQPLGDRLARRPLSVAVGLAEQHVIRAGLARDHRVVTGVQLPNAENALRSQRCRFLHLLQPVDMGAAVGRHIQAYVAAGQPADRFLLRIEQPLPDLWADPDKVDQVLSNLPENAVRHGEGTVTIDITPSASPREGEDGPVANTATSVTVSDEGPGIPEESMNRVFTRFWRGSKRGGTGLGLYIVKGIVEAHGGTITVGRAPSGGAEFRFTLPAGAPEHVA